MFGATMRNCSQIPFLSFALLACLFVGCGPRTADCEVFVNDTLLLDGLVNFTPKDLTENSVLGIVKNGKMILVDNIDLQPGQCKVVLRTTKKAIAGDETFTPIHEASVAETVVLEKAEFNVPDGGFELRFTSGAQQP